MRVAATIPERLIDALDAGCSTCEFDVDTLQVNAHCNACAQRITLMAYYLFRCEKREIGPAPAPPSRPEQKVLDDPLCG